MTCKLTLFIPQLLRPPEALSQLTDTDRPALPALTRLLSRAQCTVEAETEQYTTLFRQFGFVPAAGQDLPLAAVTHAAVAQEKDQRWWLRIDPIHVQLDHNAVVPMAHTELDISQAECEQLLQSLNEHFQGEGWQIEAMGPHDWVLTSHKNTDIRTTPLTQVMYHNMNDCLPSGPDAIYWHGVMNEIQMLLHHHPLNRVRAEKGQLLVNSVWLWGSGIVPEFHALRWQRVFANDPLTRGLAAVTGITMDAPERLWSVLDDKGDENMLLVLSDCQSAHDNMAWFAALGRLEQEWFQALLSAVKRHRIDRLNIISGDGRQFQLSAGSLRRWWRRTKKIEYWLDGHDKD